MRPPAYSVLVSESMLQQTRVETVIDYYARWMARWPTPAGLAAAQPEQVMAAWSGLGYYNRARNLHAAAQIVVDKYDGRLPEDRADLAALPGVGPYTLGALRSIAFGHPEPLVDGNVGRVLSRWHALEDAPTSSTGRRALWQHAARWLELAPSRVCPGLWNEALMELGATICRPRQPDCGICPVSRDCQARRLGRQGELPAPRPKPPPKPVEAAAAVVVHAGHGETLVLLGRRPAGGRWPGLWQPPMMEGPGSDAHLLEWLAGAGFKLQSELPPMVHILTHRRYQVQSWLAHSQGDTATDLPPLTDHVPLRWWPLQDALTAGRGLSRLAVRLLEQAG